MALAGERTAGPVRPSLAKSHFSQLGHEIEFGRPRIPMMRVESMRAVTGKPILVRSEPLLGEVVGVEPEVCVRQAERIRGLARWHSTQLRHLEFDNEATARDEMRGSVAEARDLFRLREEIADGV